MQFSPRFITGLTLFSLAGTVYGQEREVEEVHVIADLLFKDTTAVSPTSTITASELELVNITTVEDALAHQPSLIVRKRYIGDPNGVIGVRGSNMFQTARSMVFVDGMPLHYHLQSRWAGAPRWSLVSSGEIKEVQVLYGPFSAEYSGNAMGGVVNIETQTATEKKITLEGQLFRQFWDRLETNEDYDGRRIFASFENTFGDLGVYTSINHLHNESQPMTSHFSQDVDRTPTAVAQSGAIEGVDDMNRPGVYFGDTGSEVVETNQYKIKLNYDTGNYQSRAIAVYEDRARNEDDSNNYLRDANNQPIYDRNFTVAGDPNAFVYDTTAFGTSVFQNRHHNRESLLLGFGLSGLIGNSGWIFDGFYSNFQVLDDVEIRTGADPRDPAYEDVNQQFRARKTEYDNTGWNIFDVKAGTESLFDIDTMRLSAGYHFDSYTLEINPVNYNAITNEEGNARDSSGGEASTHALFAQYGYGISEHWDVSLGLRYEYWEAKDGFIGIPGDEDFIEVPTRTESGFSPKFSLAFLPFEDSEIRYSFARALRFPIVEELFRNEETGVTQIVANANLKPEDGIHHNVSYLKEISDGEIQFNIFHEVIENAIFTYTPTDSSIPSTALPTDEVTTTGAEFIYNQQRLFGSLASLRFNVTYADSEITENALNEDIVGNQFPRMPYWRSNLILGYPLGDSFDISGNFRYASNSYGTLENSDKVSKVFGAHDAFLIFGAKGNWRASESLLLSLGIDNVTNEEVYVHHPWPARTVYLEGKVSF